MGFLDQVKALFTPPAGGADSMATWLYVKCSRCGSPLAVRVDLRNEPSIDYESGGYVLNKEMMDSKCFTLMHAQLRFDSRRNIVEKRVEKGAFITKEEYDGMRNGK
jgi:hypothetical protein